MALPLARTIVKYIYVVVLTVYEQFVRNSGSKRQWRKNMDPFSPITKYLFPQVGIGNVTKLFQFVLYVDDNISYYDLTDILLLGVSFISCYCKKNFLQL